LRVAHDAPDNRSEPDDADTIANADHGVLLFPTLRDGCPATIG
jgi:hypothetical protein